MKICARCGQKLKDSEVFCNRCGGTDFKAPSTNVSNTPQNQNKQMQGQPRQPQQNVNKQPRPQMQPQQRQQGMQGQIPVQPQINNQQQQQQMYNQQQQGYNQQSVIEQPQKKKLFKSKAEKAAELEALRELQRQKQQGQGQYINNNQQGQYNQQAQYNQFEDTPLNEMTVKDWIKTLLFMLIPIFNIVYIIKNMNNPLMNEYKRNFLKAYGLYFLITFGISLIAAIIITLI